MLHKAGASALDTRACIHARCPATVGPAAAFRSPVVSVIRSPVVLSLHAPSSSSSSSNRHCTCRTASVDAPSIGSSGISSSSSSSSTSLVLRRSLLTDQLLEGTPQQQQQQGYEPDQSEEAPDSATNQTGSSSSRPAGFGGKQQSRGQRQQQQRIDVRPDAPCPCKSGLHYKACCQPFVAATAYPKSAPELVRARITAALAGKPEFLVSTTHPDSSLALGGRRSLMSGAKRQATHFRRSKCEVVGMAHCPGDEEGTWLVLAILQSSAGELKGEKAPYMELIARKSWSEQQQQQQQGLGANGSTVADSRDGQNAAGGASARGSSEDRWMFYKQTNQLPANGGAEALVALLQQHVPELLSDGEVDESAQQQGVINRQVYFNWVTPCFAGSSSSSGGGAGSSNSNWYVDLLTPAVERLAAGNDISSSSTQAGSSSSSSSGRAAQQQLSLLPPGVFRMDDWLEQQRELHGQQGRQKPALSLKAAAAAATALTAQ